MQRRVCGVPEDLQAPAAVITFIQPHVSKAIQPPVRSHRTIGHRSEGSPLQSPGHRRFHASVRGGSGEFNGVSPCPAVVRRNRHAGWHPGGGLSAAPGGDPPVVTNSGAPVQAHPCRRTGIGSGSQRLVVASIAHPFSRTLPIHSRHRNVMVITHPPRRQPLACDKCLPGKRMRRQQAQFVLRLHPRVQPRQVTPGRMA